jgi:hypothetical protein
MDNQILTDSIMQLEDLIESMQEVNSISCNGEGHAELAELDLLRKLALLELPDHASIVVRAFIIKEFNRIREFIVENGDN